MDERIQQFRIGVMVLAAILVGAILIAMFGKLPTVGQGSYPLTIKFNNAQGISANSPVRFSGILVGRVESIVLDPERKAIVKINLNDTYKIRKDDTVQISSTLLGDGEIQIVPSLKQAAVEDYYQPNDTLIGNTGSSLTNAVADLQPDIKEAINAIKELAATSKSILQGSDQADVGKTLKEAIESFKSTSDSIRANSEAINKFINNDQLRGELKDLPEILATTKGAIVSLGKTLDGVEPLVKNLNSVVSNIDNFTKPLGGEQSRQTLANIAQSVERLNSTLAEIETFSKQLNSREGTVGQLLHNPQLYQQLNEAAANINDVSQKLKPIVGDVRILSDRLSRNPGIILRDAVQPGPGTKYTVPER